MMRIVVIGLLLIVSACMTQENRQPEITAAGGLVFPPAAKEQRVEGYVVVSYDVTAEGTVVNAKVVESAPPGIFDEAALAAVRTWRFQPAVRSGAPAPAYGLTSKVSFKLGESDEYAR
jgi:TonB family protein